MYPEGSAIDNQMVPIEHLKRVTNYTDFGTGVGLGGIENCNLIFRHAIVAEHGAQIIGANDLRFLAFGAGQPVATGNPLANWTRRLRFY